MMKPDNAHGARGNASSSASDATREAAVSVESTLNAIFQVRPDPVQGPREEMLRCIEACIACATACTACADACFAEDPLHDPASCILMNTDCADICHVTGQVLMRQLEPDWQLLRKQVDKCRIACDYLLEALPA